MQLGWAGLASMAAAAAHQPDQPLQLAAGWGERASCGRAGTLNRPLVACPLYPPGPPFRLLGVDVYTFDFKLFHIAQHVQVGGLPACLPGGPVWSS